MGIVLGCAGAPLFALLAAFTAAFLAKETYILSVLLPCGAFMVAGRGARAPWRIGGAALAGFALGAVFNKIAGSVFLGAGATANSPYYIDMSPRSVVAEWLRYAGEAGAALWIYLAIVVVAVVIATRRRLGVSAVFALLTVSAGGLAAWLPQLGAAERSHRRLFVGGSLSAVHPRAVARAPVVRACAGPCSRP